MSLVQEVGTLVGSHFIGEFAWSAILAFKISKLSQANDIMGRCSLLDG